MSNITQRPNFKVIITGGFLLAMNAGYLGALSLAGLHSGATISHVTGDVVRSGIFVSHLIIGGTSTNTTLNYPFMPVSNATQSDYMFYFTRMSLVWISYIIGSMLSTIIVSGTKAFNIRRTYGWALLLESLLLGLSFILSERSKARTGYWFSEYFGAAACGVQNALCTSYSGAVIRTTHVTGTVTDIGMAIGQEIRIKFYLPIRSKFYLWWLKYYSNNPIHSNLPQNEDELEILSDVLVEQNSNNRTSNNQNNDSLLQKVKQEYPEEDSILWKLKVLVPLLFGYLFGACIGSLVYFHYGNISMLVPCVFVGILGFIYVISATIIQWYQTVQKVTQIPLRLIMTNVQPDRDTNIQKSERLSSVPANGV